jgi:hypothetical protein
VKPSALSHLDYTPFTKFNDYTPFTKYKLFNDYMPFNQSLDRCLGVALAARVDVLMAGTP